MARYQIALLRNTFRITLLMAILSIVYYIEFVFYIHGTLVLMLLQFLHLNHVPILYYISMLSR